MKIKVEPVLEDERVVGWSMSSDDGSKVQYKHRDAAIAGAATRAMLSSGPIIIEVVR